MPKKCLTLNERKPAAGVLPTEFVSTEQATALTKVLGLTLEEQSEVAGGARKAAACCKPDGGTCCVNKS